MRLTDLLALSHVPRWTIVDHLKPQSVADHTFRVMVIATELAARLNICLSADTLLYILNHDACECRTGDVPPTAKNYLPGFKSMDWVFCPWITRDERVTLDQAGIVVLADKIEAYTFIRRYGVGPHAGRVCSLIYSDIFRLCGDKGGLERAVTEILGLIDADADR